MRTTIADTDGMICVACSGARWPRTMLFGYSSGLSTSRILGRRVAVCVTYVKRVSCDRFVRVGWFPACAATSAPAYLFSCALKSLHCLERCGVSCVAYLLDGIRRCYDAFSPRVACATRGDTEARPVIHACCAHRRFIRGSLGVPDLADTEPCAGTGSLALICPNKAFSLFTNDGRSRLDPSSATVAGRAHAAPTSKRNATWLILPVVICLSQRLSHACVSMN